MNPAQFQAVWPSSICALRSWAISDRISLTPLKSQRWLEKGILNLSGSISEVIALADASLAIEKIEKGIGNLMRIVLQP